MLNDLKTCSHLISEYDKQQFRTGAISAGRNAEQPIEGHVKETVEDSRIKLLHTLDPLSIQLHSEKHTLFFQVFATLERNPCINFFRNFFRQILETSSVFLARLIRFLGLSWTLKQTQKVIYHFY